VREAVKGAVGGAPDSLIQKNRTRTIFFVAGIEQQPSKLLAAGSNPASDAKKKRAVGVN
jgi:hypothetical protein